MRKRSGSLLERDVARIFKLIGLKPKLNEKIGNYEIDVLVYFKGIKLGIECKQYEKSSLAIRNLIHEWNSKSKELKLDKVLFVLVGCNITDKDRQLAKKYGITIWDGQKFEELFSKAIEKREAVKDEILLEAGVKPSKEVAEKIQKIKKEYGCNEEQAIKILRDEVDEFDRFIMRLTKELGCSWEDAETFYWIYWDNWIGYFTENELDKTIEELTKKQKTASYLERRKIGKKIKGILKIKEYCAEIKTLFKKYWIIPKQNGQEPELDKFIEEGHKIKAKIEKIPERYEVNVHVPNRR